MLGSLVRGLTRSREDAREQFERLMSDSHRQAYSTALRLTGNPTEAEDLMQEAYVRAYRFFHRYDDSLPFTSWLFRIMTNLHIDAVRRKTRLRMISLEQSGSDGDRSWDVPDTRMNADEALAHESLGDRIQLGLRAMNPEFRTAIVLSDIEGMSYEEVADAMQTSVGTVRSRIHRGRKQLRSYLESNGFTPREDHEEEDR